MQRCHSERKNRAVSASPIPYPGNNLWPRTPGGTLQLIAVMSEAWGKLSTQGQADAKQKIGIKGPWPAATVDTSFSGLNGAQDRQYASNGFGLKRWSYQ